MSTSNCSVSDDSEASRKAVAVGTAVGQAPKCHAGQTAARGAAGVPSRHVLEEAHHPQLRPLLQAVQLANEEQGGGRGHVAQNHVSPAALLHDAPAAGPPKGPSKQRPPPAVAHQPQAGLASRHVQHDEARQGGEEAAAPTSATMTSSILTCRDHPQ